MAAVNSTLTGFSRRAFLERAAHWSALAATAPFMKLPALSKSVLFGSRVAQAPIVDKGFASVRKVGNGLYATISDTSKGLQTMCNGGFLTGKDASLLVEGFVSPAGSAFQHETLKSVSQAPVMGAVDTHYHFDHSFGNAYYGANGISIWAHAATAKRMTESYASLQGADKSAIIGPYEAQAKNGKTELARKHLAEYAAVLSNLFNAAQGTVLGFPNRPLDPAKLPMKLDLGGLTAVVESYPGHSGTDVIVRVPEQNVVYAGDLLFNHFYPVAFDDQCTVSGWRATLKKFLSWGKETVFIPGHGQLCGPEAVQFSLDLFDDIGAQAEKMYKSGVPVEDARDQYAVPEKYKDVAIFAWYFTIGPTINKLYKEWGGK